MTERDLAILASGVAAMCTLFAGYADTERRYWRRKFLDTLGHGDEARHATISRPETPEVRVGRQVNEAAAASAAAEERTIARGAEELIKLAAASGQVLRREDAIADATAMVRGTWRPEGEALT